jgi:xanthine dehydrogenase accessory factor
MELSTRIAELIKAKKQAALCIIVQSRGSTPRSIGSKMLVLEDGSIHGTIGGGALEKSVIVQAMDIIRTRVPQTFRHDLLHQHSMCCGGSVDIYIEPIMSKQKLYIFGAGHTGHALARHAVMLEFEVVLIDDRKEFLSAIEITDVNKLHLQYEQALRLLPFDEHTYVCIMTYDHAYDRDILAYCIKKPYAYLGMIGSERKVELTKKMFAEAQIAATSELESVNMPMGEPIGAETPDEIAISILARMIQVRRNVKVE